MRSIVYAGNDFSDVCSAEVVARSANPIIAEYMRVPGRAGALLVTGYIPPVDVTVRLFMDMGYNPGFAGMAQMRAKVRRWLSWPGGGNLILPDDPEVEYRDAILVGAADWSNLFEDGECQLTFTLFDPIGWGAERVARTARFDVGGNWPTLPEIRLVAAAGSYLQVSVPAVGRGIRVDHEFAGGEAVVVRTEEPLEGLCSVYAESSLCEMLDDFIEEAQLVSRTARQALTAVLAPTRWSIAYCASLGTAGALIYQQNALWALRRVAEVWGGEVTPIITVANRRVASRAIRLDDERGEWRGLRFTYGKNMAGCTRTVLEQDVYTALYGFGAGLPFTDEDGNYKAGYRRKLTFGDINGGLNYVADESAKLVWGRWNADRTARVHSFGQVTFSDVTEPERLIVLTRRALAEATQPKVSYEIDVAALDGDDAELGDTVAVIDTSRDPEWRLTARVVRRVRTFDETVVARVTVGTVQKADYEQVSALAADVATLQNDVVGIDGNLTSAASTERVNETVTEAIDDLDELADLDF